MKQPTDADIPLVFVHTGPSQAIVTACVAQAKAAGCKRIFVISDRVGPWVVIPGVHHFPFVNADKYGALEFRSVFVNYSCYSPEYAAIIFEKFFAIRALFAMYSVERLLYVDSDVLLFKSTEELSAAYPCDFTGTSVHMDNYATVSPGVLFMNPKVCDRICSDLMTAYGTAEGRTRLMELWERKKAIDPNFGVCEMDFLAFLRDSGDFHYIAVNHGNPCVDAAIDNLEGCIGENGIKKIAFENGMPYGIREKTGEKVFFYNLHMNGGLKYLAIHHAQIKRFYKRLIYAIWRLEKRGLLKWPKGAFGPVAR